MNIQGILFDLDDTLIPSEEIYIQGLRYAHARLGEEKRLSWPAFLRYYRQARALVKSRLGENPAARNRVLYFKELVELIFGSSHPALTLALFHAYNRAWRSIDATAVREIAARLVRHYPLGIITNQVTLMQLQKMARIDPQGKLFKVLVTAEEAGVEKPRIPIYRLACRRLGVPAARILLVGDSWQADVRGGLRAGMQVAFLCPGKPPSRMPRHTFQVSSLQALVTRILG